MTRMLHHGRHRWMGRKVKGLEPEPFHPISQLIIRPNPYMLGCQLVEAIALHLSLEGECFLLPIPPNGGRWSPGQEVEEIYPILPRHMREVCDPVTGQLLFWEWTPGLNKGFGRYMLQRLLPDEIIQLKYYNPKNLFRGAAPIASAAMAITQDLLSDSHNTATLENGADPGGILVYEGKLDPEDRERYRAEFLDRHQGPENRRRLAILENGFDYRSTGMSHEDMEFMEQKKWNREQVLAVLRVPKAILSITDDLNYATQLGQDRNFWNKCLIPIVKMIESVFSMTLLYGEPDTVVVAFDLSSV